MSINHLLIPLKSLFFSYLGHTFKLCKFEFIKAGYKARLSIRVLISKLSKYVEKTDLVSTNPIRKQTNFSAAQVTDGGTNAKKLSKSD